MRRLLPLLLLLAAPVPAHAGDPCPIGLELHEYTPEWRSRADDLAALRSKRAWIGVNYRGDDTVTIQRTIPGSPAHAAGLLRGDVIAAFDGVPVGGQKHLNEALPAIVKAKGKPAGDNALNAAEWAEAVQELAEDEGVSRDVAEREMEADSANLDQMKGQVVSTQFYMSELDAAIARVKADLAGTVEEKVATWAGQVGSVAQGAATQSYAAVAAALQNSTLDGTSAQKSAALGELSSISASSWAAYPGVSDKFKVFG